MKKLTLLSLFIVFSLQASFAQTNKELAATKLKEAIKLEDEDGKYDEALVLILEAQKLDPESYTYPFELAYTYNAKKEYQKAIDYLLPLLKHRDVSDETYQSLGNNYDYLEQPTKAIDTYQKGLLLYPNSGKLNTEMGNMYLIDKKLTQALEYYEKSIKLDPQYSPAYYRAAKLYLNGKEEEVWGMIYGEIYMNLNRNSDRTEEMSKLLYDTYKSEITFPAAGQVGVSFSKSTKRLPNQVVNGRSPFPMIYEQGLITGSSTEQAIDINSLSRIRTTGLGYYSMLDAQVPIKNILFDYQTKVKNAGHLDAYNHWILLKGDETAFNTWQADNQAKWDAFITWFRQNGLEIAK
ncbi:MAG: tetratricopeptide repeat protein [Bacteroidota bacterium]